MSNEDLISVPVGALPERLIIVCGPAEDIVHLSQFSTGTLHQHDEVLCDPTRLEPGDWYFAPPNRTVNCVFCLGVVDASP